MRTGRNARTKLLRAHARARTHMHTHTTYAYDAQVMRRSQEFGPPARDRTLRGTVCLDLAFNIERVGVGVGCQSLLGRESFMCCFRCARTFEVCACGRLGSPLVLVPGPKALGLFEAGLICAPVLMLG